MKTKDQEILEQYVGRRTLAIFSLMALLFWLASEAGAEPQGQKGIEMTPGPRMIRAVEALANDTLAASEILRLTPEQQAEIRREVVAFKKDIWKKEAVLIGMFEEVALKRRHGLLLREEYRAANQLTGGLETDELGRMMRAIGMLQGLLTPDQKEAFRTIRKPQMNLELPEGFNTRIGLMALGRYGQIYGEYREALGLSETQKVSLRNALEEARREIIHIGTEIDLGRKEAYDLLKEPIIDMKKTEEAMEKNARMEGVIFSKLFEITAKMDGILTQPQRARMEEIRRESPRHRLGSGMEAVASSKEELSLSRPQIEKLVALEIAAARQEELREAELKIQHLELEERIKEGASEKEIEGQINRIAQLVADMERDRLQARVAGMVLRMSFVE